MDPTEPGFWEQRYLAGHIPWDQRGVPPALVEFLRTAPAKGSVLIPGCGSGHEVRAFHDAGWHALAIDFSPAAVAQARAALGALAGAVRLADFFADEFGDPFDAVYERTFLCSLPPDRWPDYVRRMTQVLAPGGSLLGIFAYGEEPEPPPYPLTGKMARNLFESHFTLVSDIPIPADQSVPLFAGREHWQVWRR